MSADCRALAAETGAPEFVADQNCVVAGGALLGSEGTPVRRTHTEHREKGCGDGRAAKTRCLACARQRGLHLIEGCDRFDRAGESPVLQEVRFIHPRAIDERPTLGFVRDDHQPIGIVERQWSHEDAVDDGEHRRGRADSQRKRADRNGGESRRTTE